MIERSKSLCLTFYFPIVHQHVTYKCEKCSYESKTKRSLADHVVREHSEAPLDLKCDFKCESCAYQTYSRQNFARHLKFNHNPNQMLFSCSECGKSFGAQRYLMRHAATHAEGAEFACNVCSHVCKTEVGLKSHMTLHQEMKYECPVCSLKRRSAHEVRMHCKRKHPKYKLPPKYTVLKTTSKLHGKKLQFKQDEESNE